jgi:hypothetical protein
MFEVGKKVICIKDHSQSHLNGVKKGKIYTVKDIKSSPCNCQFNGLDIGIYDYKGKLGYCLFCNKVFTLTSNIWYMDCRLFEPLIEEEVGNAYLEELIEETINV